MSNKKLLLWFYLIGMPIVLIWAYKVTRTPEYIPLETSPFDITYHEEYVADQFWYVVGVGAFWIGLAYIIVIVIRKLISKK